MKKKIANPELLKVINLLRVRSNETGSAIWGDLAKKLSGSRHRRVCVNLSQIDRYSKEGELLVVPGKVLGTGRINHPVHVSAFSFSKKAGEEIMAAGGECLTIPELFKRHPHGSKIRIIG